MSKGRRAINRLQFTSVNGVDPCLRFSSPFCLDLLDVLFIETFP